MKLAAIDVNLIVALDALLGERSVTRAARRIGLSQPAMSHSLARLRELLDDPLLVRTGREMALTERAQALVADVADAIDRLTHVFSARPSFDPVTAERVFRIAATDYTQFMLLPTLDRILSDEAPGVSVHMHPWSRPDMVSLLRNRDLDLVVGILPLPAMKPLPDDIHTMALYDEHRVCIGRKGHPGLRRPLTLERYCALSHIQISLSGNPASAPGPPGPAVSSPAAARGAGEQASDVDRLLAERGLGRRIAMTVPHFLLVPHIVAHSDHVALLSEHVARPFTRILPLRLVKPPFESGTATIGAIWHQRTDGDAAHDWLRKLVQRCIRGVTTSS